MEQQYESNFYIAAMQSISSLGAATIRDLVEKLEILMRHGVLYKIVRT